MDYLSLLLKTVLLRPYVFLFLAAFLFAASRLIGWKRTGCFTGITWFAAFVCEFSSTRTGIPFGWYHYTGSTVGQELYLSNVPFMDSLSFTFLLYASYCTALLFVLPAAQPDASAPAAPRARPRLSFAGKSRRAWPVLLLTPLLFAYLDLVIDPVALRGDRWFLGRIYYYPEPGLHFGVTLANYVGWWVVGMLALFAYTLADRRLPDAELPVRDPAGVTDALLLGCGLYYGVLAFNLAVTFWIGEALLGLTGVLIYIPITVLLALRLAGQLSGPPSSDLLAGPH
jgi:putative membrane protein